MELKNQITQGYQGKALSVEWLKQKKDYQNLQKGRVTRLLNKRR